MRDTMPTPTRRRLSTICWSALSMNCRQSLHQPPEALADDLGGVGDEHEALRVDLTGELTELDGLIAVDHSENDGLVLVGVGALRPLLGGGALESR